MAEDDSLLETPLYDAHVKAGARMVPFAGFRMPVQYTGIVDEHLAVRTRAGLFDVSHMGEVEVRGPRALDYLQHVTCNDVSKLVPGRAQYSALLLPNGAFVDDLLVYMLGEGDFLVVVNASNRGKDVAWMLERRPDAGVAVEDVSERFAQIAIQGPRAVEILRRVTGLDLEAMRYYHFAHGEVAGTRALVSRTGYTGEDGFELYVAADEAPDLWYALLGEGGPMGLVPAGLGARDTLRLEAKMALYGNDIDDTTTALEADLSWIVKFEKGDFVGREALARQREAGLDRKLVGFEMEGRAIGRHGYAAMLDGAPVGRVTSGTRAPFLERNIGLAYLPPALWEPGSEFQIDVRGRAEAARVVPTPFYKRPKK